MKKEELLDKIRLAVKQHDNDAEIYLFGSRARGDNRRNSDWDLLILVNEENISNKIDDKFRSSLYDIELEIGQVISILIYPKLYWKTQLKHSSLYRNVIQKGIQL